MLGLVGGSRAGPRVPVAAAPGVVGRPSTAVPGAHAPYDRWYDRWRRSPIPPIPTASSHPGSRVRAALTRGQDRRRCGPDRPSTTPTGKASSPPPRPGSLPLPKRPRNAVVGAAPAAKAERPRGDARAPGPAEGPETTPAPLLGPRPARAARDSVVRRPTPPPPRKAPPCRAPWASRRIRSSARSTA